MNNKTGTVNLAVPPLSHRERVDEARHPQIDYFMREDPGVMLDKWLPSLRHTAEWNEWD